jgi:sigma-B regulation protein RsbU (phosphoserine phosphatase)
MKSVSGIINIIIEWIVAMSIRIKVFLILLIFGLTPLLVITITSRQSITRLGDDLSRDARTHQTATISRDLEQSARVSAAAISQSVASLQLSLQYLAGSTENALALPGTPAEARYYTSEDFSRPETAPPDTHMSWRYPRITSGGVLMPSAISTRYPVVVVPAGHAKELKPQLHRLLALTPVFQEIYRMNQAVAHRIYVGLENGLHVSFPGHGRLGPGFDPRQRPWFDETRQRGELTWLSHTDASTQKLVFTVAVPIHDRQKRFIGVAAIDMLPGEFMQMDQLRSQWSQDTLAFLVMPETDPLQGLQKLEIIASGNPLGEESETRSEVKDDYFDFPDPDQNGTLIDALKSSDSGTLELPYKGTPSIWAFSHFQPPVDSALRIILIVPESLVSSLSQQVSKNVLNHTHRIYRVTGIIAALLLGFVLLVGWIGTRTMLQPLYAMVRAWNRLSTGDFTVRLNARTGDERDILINAFNDIVPRLEAHWNLSRSMELARQIQRNLLPDQTPHLPGLDLAGDSHYCDQTGGDYYDVFKTGTTEDQCFAVVVGDVSGHGVASALLMTTARAMIRSMSTLEKDPARRITLVNRLLFPDTSATGDFITLFYLEFDLGRRRLRWVRAGHDPALLYDPQTDQFSELTGDGMALGIEEAYQFVYQAAPMGHAGQIIVIGTDGIWEAHNSQREMFGKDRLCQIIRNHHHHDAHDIRDAVFKAVEEFAGRHQDDDITLAVIKLL